MRPNTLKLSLVLALSLATLAACDKHDAKSEPAAAPATTSAAVAPAPAATATTTAMAPATTPAPGGEASGGKKAWKLACADDLKKFCADADKPGRCLKQHESEISEGCKTARAEARAAHKAAMADKAQ